MKPPGARQSRAELGRVRQSRAESGRAEQSRAEQSPGVEPILSGWARTGMSGCARTGVDGVGYVGRGWAEVWSRRRGHRGQGQGREMWATTASQGGWDDEGWTGPGLMDWN